MPRKLTIKEVKERIKKAHGDTVVLDESTYTNTRIKARFIDKDYGEFYMRPDKVMDGFRHHKKFKTGLIANSKKRLYEVHGDTVILDESTYINSNIKARFIDKDYGEWWATPGSVLSGCEHMERANHKKKQEYLKKHGVENPLQNIEVREKIRQTNIERYGVENPFQREEVREKSKQTCLERHGVEYPLQSEKIKEKTKQTNLERHGVEYPPQSEEIKEKTRQTNLERYGVEYVSQDKKIIKKTKKTNLERYGVENVSQNEEIKEKIRQTNLERHGVEYPMQREEVREKSDQTCLKKYGVKNSSQDKNIRKKQKQTCLERYGVEHPLESEEMKEKSRQTSLKRYGVEHPMQNPEIALKAARSSNKSYILEHWKTNEELVCTAGYEKKVVEYLNKNEIDFKWQCKSFPMILLSGKKTTYRPDLYLIGEKTLWVEIKGYFRGDAEEKWNIFHNEIKSNSELWNKEKLEEMGIL